MSGISGYSTLKQIVSNVMNDLGEAGDMGKFYQYMQFAIRGCKELGMFSLNLPQQAKIQMSSINTIDLPPDFVSFVKIGIPYKGRLWEFTKEERLLSPQDDAGGVEVLDTTDGEDTVIGDGGGVAGYGMQGGMNSYYYKLDLTNNRIIINGSPRREVILVYTGTGVKKDGSTFIPKMAEEALIAWVHWKRLQHSTASLNERDYAKREYYEQAAKLEFVQAPSLNDYYDSIYESFIQTAKR